MTIKSVNDATEYCLKHDLHDVINWFCKSGFEVTCEDYIDRVEAIRYERENSSTIVKSTSEETMGATLQEHNKPKLAVADVVHYGEKMILPEHMSLDEGIDLLKRRKTFMTETVAHSATFKVFPWDGAYAFANVLRNRYGWAPGIPIRSFFGDKPPQVVQIESGVNETVDIPWGAFEIPGTTIVINTGGTFQGNDVLFTLSGECKRVDEETLKALFVAVREECAKNSLYRGKAITIKFNDDNGKVNNVPIVSFMDTSIDESKVIYSDEVQAMIDTALFTPIRRVKDLELNNIPFKSGVLLGGVFGTGKTLAAKVASKLAVQNNVTFIYIRRADEITRAIQFARLYEESAAVVFCEDIDRVTKEGRDAVMDNILNTIDGIDSKRTRVMVVATTNDLESINPAMLRPGRMDAVINVTPPDAKAVVRLIKAYGGDAIPEDENLDAAGAALAGHIPAVVAEVVQRAKKVQLKLLGPGQRVTKLTSHALTEAAKTIQQQTELLKPKEKNVLPTLDQVVQGIVRDATASQKNRVEEVNRRSKDILEAVNG